MFPSSFSNQLSLSGYYFYARKVFFWLLLLFCISTSRMYIFCLFLGQLFLHKQAWMYLGLLRAVQRQVICYACVQLHRLLSKLLNILAKPKS